MSALLSCTLFYQLRTAFVLQHLCFLSAFLFVHKMNVERTGRPSSLVQVQLDSIRQFGRIKHCRPVHLGKENFKTSSVLALLVSTETLMMVTHDSILPLTPPPLLLASHFQGICIYSYLSVNFPQPRVHRKRQLPIPRWTCPGCPLVAGLNYLRADTFICKSEN